MYPGNCSSRECLGRSYGGWIAQVGLILSSLTLSLSPSLSHSDNDSHLINLIPRWLHSPAALLYDPAIARSVSVLERKLCLLLATEIDRLGAKVVHASPTKILVDTGKEGVLGIVLLLR